MKNCGKIFEEDFANSFRLNNEVFIYRLRDSSGAWGNQNNNAKVRFTSKNICDFIAYSYKSNKLLLLELKTFKGTSCPFSNLRKHQIENLYVQGRKKGVGAYFVLNFRSLNETYAVNAELIYEFYRKNERKSFSHEWCKNSGILIDARLKKTRYQYNIEKLLV